jgi:N-acetyl-anhydromuramyl-L-alanine amidase AmpD
MSNITHIVMHYSATYHDQNVTPADIRKWHLARGFSDIGYHYIITEDGTVHPGRTPETRVGAHVRGMNSGKIGICLTGGLDRATGGNTGVDNRTPAQIASQIVLTRQILSRHPGAKICGHRDLVSTQCPGYDAAAWWASVSGASPTPGAAPRPTPEAGAEVARPLCKRGSKGKVVESLQERLVALGYLGGRVDGDFGPMTEAAVKAFQGAKGLNADGIVGPATWAALFA